MPAVSRADSAEVARCYRLNSQVIGLSKREDNYHPEYNFCGLGKSCQEACGDGFEECMSTQPATLFCHNPGAGQTCCHGGQGGASITIEIGTQILEEPTNTTTEACDEGFYCVQDTDQRTLCCQEVRRHRMPYNFISILTACRGST